MDFLFSTIYFIELTSFDVACNDENQMDWTNNEPIDPRSVLSNLLSSVLYFVCFSFGVVKTELFQFVRLFLVLFQYMDVYSKHSVRNINSVIAYG